MDQLNPNKNYTNSELRQLGIFGVIYKLTNEINGKIYVGKTIDLYNRARSRVADARAGRYHYNNGIEAAISKYGKQNFVYKIIDYVKMGSDFDYMQHRKLENDLARKEVYWIKRLNALEEGYNLTEGGEKLYPVETPVLQYDLEGNFIQEWDSVKEANVELDVHHNSVSGIPRVCMGVARIAFGYQWRYKESEDFPKQIDPVPSEYRILQYSKKGEYIREFRSPKDAAMKIGKPYSNNKIGESAKTGDPVTAYGYQWRYKESEEFPQKIPSAKDQNDLLKYYKEKAKPVIQYDLEGNYVNDFRTTDEAEEKTGISRVTIQKVASGQYSHAGGFQWIYKEENHILDKISPYRNPITKKVYQYNRKTGELIGTWKSARQVCRENEGWDYKQISSAAHGHQRTYKDFVWSFEQLSKKEVIEKGRRRTNGKTVYQYTKDGSKLIAKYSSTREAARELGVKVGSGSSSIARVARGERNSYKGYHFSYEKS